MTLSDAIEMAEMCALNARATGDPRACGELWKMALEYQKWAAEMGGGRKPDIGPPPPLTRIKADRPVFRATAPRR
jgi:hypothetical protein